MSERFGHPLGAAIHAILWREWDPLGVNDIAPDDEYDNYVRQMIERLDAGETVATIAKHLGWLAREYMGAPQRLEHSRAIASKLVALRDQGNLA
ncbi:MAG: hypothetical protein HY859_16130 [Caulobacterales bacterium]|nr:hypothetical protein [Caulobacterales bacterium]